MSSQVLYAQGSEVAVLSNTFTAANVPQDPTSITLVVTDPQGVQTNWSYPTGPNLLTRVSAGVFQAVQSVVNNDGLWNYVWAATWTGGVLDIPVVVSNFRAFPTLTGQWYTSLAELKSRMSITDAGADFELQLAVAGAAKWIEGRCGRHFYQLTETRTFVPESIWEAHVDDLVSVSALSTDPNGDGSFPLAWTQNVDYELALGRGAYNPNASGEPRPYKAIYVIGGGNKFFPFVWPLYRADRIKITGVWGWPKVPWRITQASLLLSEQLFKLKDAPFGTHGTAETGVYAIGAGVQLQVEGLLTDYIDPTRKVSV